jgi:competence protein ComGC
MEHQWQTTLSPEEQLETRTKNPSLEDLAREKQVKDKIDAAKAKALKTAQAKGGKKAVVHMVQEEEEADEIAHREEERQRDIELEAKKAVTADEIEREESMVGVPVAKVSHPLLAGSFVV